MTTRRAFHRSALAASLACTLGVAGAAPRKRYSAYLLVYFTDETLPDGEQIYFALSRDALRWEDLNGGRPVLRSTVGTGGARDPSIVRAPGGDKFYLLATDLHIYQSKDWAASTRTGGTAMVVWESADLVNWSAPRRVDVASNIPTAGCVWAPEAIYDEASGDYFVYWTTVTWEGARKLGRIYYSRTRDFRSFTPAQLYMKRADDKFLLDTQIVRTDLADPRMRYVRVSADGVTEASDRLLGVWRPLGDLSHTALHGQVEGPIMFAYNEGGKWGLWMDQFRAKKGYTALVAMDLGRKHAFTPVPSDELALGKVKKRHGAIIGITDSEYRALKTRYPIK